MHLHRMEVIARLDGWIQKGGQSRGRSRQRLGANILIIHKSFEFCETNELATRTNCNSKVNREKNSLLIGVTWHLGARRILLYGDFFFNTDIITGYMKIKLIFILFSQDGLLHPNSDNLIGLSAPHFCWVCRGLLKWAIRRTEPDNYQFQVSTLNLQLELIWVSICMEYPMNEWAFPPIIWNGNYPDSVNVNVQ